MEAEALPLVDTAIVCHPSTVVSDEPPMTPARNDEQICDRIFDRARKIAKEEQTAFFKSLKAMPPEFVERIAGVVIRHEQRLSKEMISRGVDPDATSMTERDGKVVVMFLLNIRQQYDKVPGDFRREFRRIMCQELADLAGMEWLGELEP